MENIVLVLVIMIFAVLIYKKMRVRKPACRKYVKRAPPRPVVRDQPELSEYDYQDVLHEAGLQPEQFQSHNKFVEETFSDSLLLGASKDLVRDDVNDINPVLGMRRANYNVHIGEGARQVPSEDLSQLPKVSAPRFV